MLIIRSRYNGPPGSANGGYSAGLFATSAGLPTRHPPQPGVDAQADPVDAQADPAGPADAEAVQVTLRRPPPLEVPLTVVPAGPGQRGSALVDADGVVVAEARPAPLQEVAVPPVPWETAVQASSGYVGFTDHPFPTCYVCGPRHPDGLRVFPGVLADGRTAAPFTAPREIAPETVWAALDCPGGWAVLSPGRAYVLGRMAAVVHALPDPGDRCVVVGRMLSNHGRKAEVQTSLYGPTGGLLAYAWATWVAIAQASGADQRSSVP